MKKIGEQLEWLRLNYSENEYVSEDIAYVAFLISLIPVPGIQQSGQILDRIFSKKSLAIQIKDIWRSISATKELIADIEDEIERVKEIGIQVDSHQELKRQVEVLVRESISAIEEDKGVEWILETSDWSYQEILNSIVHADTAKIIARNNSLNVVEKTEIRANKAHLHASNNSKNYFDKTTFSGPTGSIGMNGISTQGNITVENSSIGFGGNGAIIFGGNPNIVKGNCPFCGFGLEVDKRNLLGYAQVQCPNPLCQRVMPFSIN